MKSVFATGQQSQVAARQDQRTILHETSKFFSVVLGLSAIGLWLVPEAFDDGAVVLVRFVISFLFVGIAVCLWGVGRQQFDEEFLVDMSAQRLTHVLRGRDGIARTQGEYGLDALSLEAGVLLARESDGQEVIRLEVGKTGDRLRNFMRKSSLT